MKRQHILILIFIAHAIIINGQIADRVYQNAKIYTANVNNDFAQAIAVKDGKIIYIGTNNGISAHIDNNTQIFDVENRLIIPGIHDVHLHPLEASSSISSSCQLDSQETDPENFISVMQACNNNTPNNNGWILGSGYSIYTLLDATRDPKLILDEVYPNTPAAYMEETSHSFWVNSAGLTALGINSSSSDPIGGHIMKNANGQPNGILLDGAGDLILDAALLSNTTNDTANYDGLVNYGLPELAKNGITSIVEGRTYWKRNFIPIWQQIKANNLLTARVVLAPWVYPNDDDITQIPMLQSLYDAGDDMLKVSQIKLYSDGIIINTTAALEDPYNDNLGFPFNKGLNYITESRMTDLITKLEKTGYDFFIHVIGDRGTNESLNAIEAARTTNGDLGRRHRLTHLEIVKPSDYSRFNALNVIADMQVAGDFTNPNNWQENDALIGSNRSNNLIPLKSLHNAGAKITLSSDWDVSTLNPFVAMQNALTRTPQELPDVNSVVKAYTINGAFTMRQENKTGSIELNKYADFLILDRDIFTIPTTQISQTKVLMTRLEDTEVYKDPTFNLTLNNDVFNLDKNNIDIFPSVISDSTTIRVSQHLTIDLIAEIYTVNGQLIKKIKIKNKSTQLDLSKISEGLYIIKLNSAKLGLKTSRKIIISR